MASFDFLPLLVGSAAGVGNGLVVKASQGGRHPVLYPGIYEGALVVGGGALDYFGLNPDIGTAMMIVGAALLTERLTSRVLPGTVAAGFKARPWTPPGNQRPRPQLSGQMARAQIAEDETRGWEEVNAYNLRGARKGPVLPDRGGSWSYAVCPYNLAAAPRSGISTPGVWVNPAAGVAPGDGELRPFLDGRGGRYPIGLVA